MMLPNPWLLLSAGAVWLLSLTGVGYWQYEQGKAAQAGADQAQFDRVNNDLRLQAAQANEMLQAAHADVTAALRAREAASAQLEKRHAEYQADIDAARRKYAGLSLRFRAAENRNGGAGGSGAVPAAGDAAGTDGAAVVQLPAALTSDLRQLAIDADALAGYYRKCYEAAGATGAPAP